MKTICNPILPGFYPDPSICRAGDDYYIVASSFEFFPGVPIFHSKDLIHWRQIGNALDRPSQLNLDGVKPSDGIYAATIRFHEGTFYIATSMVGDAGDGRPMRHFIITADDPAGTWSEPYWIESPPGVDPTIFFDDGGKAYFLANRIPLDGMKFQGHREIWLQELDLHSMSLIGEPTLLLDSAYLGGIYPEGPHIYKVGGMYYLSIAEGGTFYEHAQTIGRSEGIDGPYEPNPCNPIVTHRHLGRDFPVINVGHADCVETQNGEWWMVALACRPCEGFRNLGRETFIMPMVWEEGWPVVCPGTGKIEPSYPAPDLPGHPWTPLPSSDDFDSEQLDDPRWLFLRTPREEFYSLSERKGFLRLKLRRQSMTKRENPSFVGRRQQHHDFSASAIMEFTPQNNADEAGVVALQNMDFHFRFTVARIDGHSVLRVVRRENVTEETLGKTPIDSNRLHLRIEARGQNYSFHVAESPDQWRPVAENVDGRVLSTDLAGGFTGAVIGMYASSNGAPSDNCADFDRFEYLGKER